MVVLRNFKKAQTVLYQGETPQYSFRIKKGLIRAYTIHENGDEAMIAFFARHLSYRSPLLHNANRAFLL